MLYHIKGMTPDRVRTMTWKERQWWLERLVKQRKDEKEAIKKASEKKG